MNDILQLTTLNYHAASSYRDTKHHSRTLFKLLSPQLFKIAVNICSGKILGVSGK